MNPALSRPAPKPGKSFFVPPRRRLSAWRGRIAFIPAVATGLPQALSPPPGTSKSKLSPPARRLIPAARFTCPHRAVNLSSPPGDKNAVCDS